MAIGGDLAHPHVQGERPLSWRLTNVYMERLMRAATVDGEVAAAFAPVSGMLKRPPTLFRPGVARRVLGKHGSRSLLWPGRALRTSVRRRTLRVGGIATPLREAGPRDQSEAVVFMHGVPGSGADFEPLLASAGQLGRAVAWDAPGFGRGDKPRWFTHTIDGHAAFTGHVLESLGVEQAHLVLHDFGGAWGLAWAASEPERFASVTLMCSGVLLDYDWHTLARIWRTPLAGELAMKTLTRAVFRANLRRSGPARLPGALVDRMFDDLDHQTREAILRLYRSVGDVAEQSQEMAETLRPLRRPALVIWGQHDPYLPPALANRQQEAFPAAETHVLQESGHWPFVDRADRVEQLLLDFLERALGTAGREAAAQLAAA
jgi:pimeloyl-ACP methyl ester carboxylesterase